MKPHSEGGGSLESFSRVSYLWFTPTGQYEMRQASDGVRCIRNGSGRVPAHGRLSLTRNARLAQLSE